MKERKRVLHTTIQLPNKPKQCNKNGYNCTTHTSYITPTAHLNNPNDNNCVQPAITITEYKYNCNNNSSYNLVG